MKNSIKRVQSESSLSALSSVRILREAKKIFQYILMVVAVVATASCSNEMDEALQPAGNGAIQFVVSDFPAFGEDPETRASQIGTPDAGKTDWVQNDEILITIVSQKYGIQTAKLTYNVTTTDGVKTSSWELDEEASLSYLENETPEVTAIYAPCYEVTGNTMNMKTGMQLGMTEYLVAANCTFENPATININFEDTSRDYSRLRIAATPKATLTVTTTDFTPAGANSEITDAYTFTVTADENGNAFLYGVFAEGATVSVNQGEVTLKDYTFTAEKNLNGTEHNKSYALDATPVIDGTLGGKTEATEEELAAMVELLKSHIENGLTTIIVTGSQPAKLLTQGHLIPVVSLAFEQLTYAYMDENIDSYKGTVDLIYQDVTEIVEWEFNFWDVLKSITLPNVTAVGDRGFYACYYLEILTFGSVVTAINDNSGEVFYDLGYQIGGCHLVLNKDQGNVEGLAPDLASNTWAGYIWKSITLTHTGECDGCKANQ